MSNRLFCAVLLTGLLPLVAAADDSVRFGRDVLPILSDHCFLCHGPDEKTRETDLRLDQQDSALRTEDPVIVPGKSAESSLIKRILSHDPEEQMPPPAAKRPLSPEQIAILKRWIDSGAKWGKHWAYEPPQRPDLPPVKQSAWPRNGLDRFVLADLEEVKLTPSPEATKETLIRRVTLDLTGLPPTPNECDAFLADTAPDAYERLVDRLLASPRYGERMAWDWLDAARYADSNGYQGDPERTMWPWRDWVIAAVNRNQPYDEFTIEQLAGDLLPSARVDQVIATGFNRNHMFNGEGGRIAEETRVENVMDRVETVSTVWLGLTMTCARCHDHKFDPLKQREYYQLSAYFNNTSETGGASGGGRSGQIAPVVDVIGPAELKKRDDFKHEIEELSKQITEKEATVFPREEKQKISETEAGKALPDKAKATIDKRPHERDKDGRAELATHFKDKDAEYGKLLAALNGAIGRRDSFESSIPRVMVMDEQARQRDTFILVKGAYNKTADKVTSGVPEVLPPLPEGSPNNRLALAQWLMSPGHPLTARVTVNRFWQSFFGIGLVKTVEDFGVQGERPTHPELLDWLATELVRLNWDVKALHRLIVTSATYRQSSKVTPALVQRDPDNRLLARGARFRMPSWMIRDQALAAAGLLSLKLGGPSVKPYQPSGIWEEATFGKKSYVQDHGESLYRRSLYTFWRRIVGPTMFFDSAARQTCTVKSVRTNTPLHALATLNDITYVEAARGLAERAMQSGSSPTERLDAAFRRVTARHPSSAEAAILQARFDAVKAQFTAEPAAAEKLLKVGESRAASGLDPIEHAAYASVCLLILNLDEALTKE